MIDWCVSMLFGMCVESSAVAYMGQVFSLASMLWEKHVYVRKAKIVKIVLFITVPLALLEETR